MDNGSMRAKACSARISLRRRGDNVKHPFGNRRRIAFGRRLFFGAKLLFIPHQILVNDSIYYDVKTDCGPKGRLAEDANRCFATSISPAQELTCSVLAQALLYSKMSETR